MQVLLASPGSLPNSTTVLPRILLHAGKSEFYKKLPETVLVTKPACRYSVGSAGIGEAVDIKIVHVFHDGGAGWRRETRLKNIRQTTTATAVLMTCPPPQHVEESPTRSP